MEGESISFEYNVVLYFLLMIAFYQSHTERQRRRRAAPMEGEIPFSGDRDFHELSEGGLGVGGARVILTALFNRVSRCASFRIRRSWTAAVHIFRILYTFNL
jgi:hypothetical protein